MALPTMRTMTMAQKVVAGLLLVLGILTIAGMIWMAPTGNKAAINDTVKQSLGLDDELSYGEIISEGATACNNALIGQALPVAPEFSSVHQGPNVPAGAVDGQCPAVVARVTGGPHVGHYVLLNNRIMGNSVALHPGNKIRMAQESQSEGARYVFEDLDRRVPLALWIALTCVIVVLVGSWKGLRALIGVLMTLAVVVLWMLPAIMSGKPAMTVAAIGSAAALFVVMFFVHGVSWKTASALLATIISLLAAVTISEFAVKTTAITGMAEEQNITVQIYLQQIPVLGLLVAGFIIGAIGVLNDVTISQAATVFELAEMEPRASAGRVFDAAMRVGRDHISSMLYTLVLAYTGSVLPLLLFIHQSSRGMWEVINGETIAVEIIRSLVGVIALAFCFPLTNAISIILAKPMVLQRRGRSGRDNRRGGATIAAATAGTAAVGAAGATAEAQRENQWKTALQSAQSTARGWADSVGSRFSRKQKPQMMPPAGLPPQQPPHMMTVAVPNTGSHPVVHPPAGHTGGIPLNTGALSGMATPIPSGMPQPQGEQPVPAQNTGGGRHSTGSFPAVTMRTTGSFPRIPSPEENGEQTPPGGRHAR